MKSLGKNAAFSLLYRVGNVVFPLISGMYLARVLAPEGIGQVAAVRNTMSYFLMLAAMGIPQYATREVARCREGPQALGKLTSELLVIHLAAGVVSLGGYLLFVGLLPGEKLLYWIFSLELVFQLCNIEWLFEGREEYRFIALRSLGVRVLSLGALLLFVRTPSDVPRYALILCFGTGGNHLLNVLRAKVKLTRRDLHPLRHLGPVLTLMLSGLAASLYSKVDISMLHLLSDAAAVGYYTTAYRVIGLVLTVATALTAVYFPRLSRSSPADFQRYLSGALQILLVLTVPGAVGLALVAEDLTAVLFGMEFLPAAAALGIMAPMILIRGCGDLLCYQAIISAGEEKRLIGARIWAGLANIGLNGLLIPKLGHVGAALATLISEAVVNGILLPHGLRLGKPLVPKPLAGRILFATGAMAAVVIPVQKAFDTGILSLILSVTAGAAVYLCCVIRVLNKML